jgi:hypothetical protein
MLTTKLTDRNSEINVLRTAKAEHESIIAQDKEEIQSTRRELVIKIKQLKDIEVRCNQAINEVDGYRFRV